MPRHAADLHKHAHGFHRVRTVVDEDSTGTTISADVLRVDGESAFPLYAALGIELTQTLFVGPEVMFVEGPSDVVYLQYLSDQLKSAGHIGLDERWVARDLAGGSLAQQCLHAWGDHRDELILTSPA